MREVISLDIVHFSLVYLLLLAVLAVMRRCRIRQTKLLLLASLRMTLQLVLAGLILTYILENPHPAFTVLYLAAMIVFAVYRVLSRHPGINRRFKLAIALSLAGAGLAIIVFFVCVVVGVDLFNPQYTIPLGGMIIGNAMTGMTLAMQTFTEALEAGRSRAQALLGVGAEPRSILLPMVNAALETALLPTINSMLGMGIIALPGMMTGQILSGTLPTTAILYQIAVLIAICAVVCLSVFSSLQIGYHTLYNKRAQFLF